MRLHLKIALAAAVCISSVSFLSAAIPPDYTGKPFCCDTLLGKPQQIPGQVVCVFFDSGGEGVAFHYLGGCGDAGSTMRKYANGQSIQADVPLCMQQYSGNDYDMLTDLHEVGYWHLAWIDSNGQWQKYTVHVNTAGMYYVSFHQATAYSPNCEVLTYYNGTSVKIDSIWNLPICTVPQGCPEVWHSWTMNKNVDSVMLDTGLQVFQITFLLGSWNLDWISFDLKSATGTLQPAVNRRPENGFGLKTCLSAGELALSYVVSQPGGVRIFLTDCAGKTAWSSFESGKAGLRARTVNVGNLKQGVYFVSVEQNGLREVRPLTITK
ncbi:MAG TPA: hypothetical protein VLX68_11185 [Chitinivibrionales bacterium]|nr:hypothetical protein [Chitinivibrionales bacterium]